MNDEIQESVGFEPQWPPWYTGQSDFDITDIHDDVLNDIVNTGFQKISEKMEKYETREMQVRMTIRILKSLFNNETSVIEAGTGVGKSFAYLIAAIAYSYMSGERVLVSTETKNLQWQLYIKDIPFLQESLSEKLSQELCLGSSNYLCLLRYEEAYDAGEFLDILAQDEQKNLDKWIHEVGKSKTLRASIFELEKIMKPHFWSLISRESEGCPAQKCALFNDCAYYREKRKWERSHILVGNHHLLLYHLLNESRTLPNFGAVILDEAHGFLKTAFSALTLGFSRIAVSEQKKRFDRYSRKGNLGLEKTGEISDALQTIENHWEAFFSTIETELGLSFTENQVKPLAANKSIIPNPELPTLLDKLSKDLKDIIENEEDPTGVNNLKMFSAFLKTANEFIHLFPPSSNERVYWAEKRDGLLYVYSCPLNPGEQLAELLDVPQVWTSATIGYWPNRNMPVKKSELINGGYFNAFIAEALSKTPLNISVDVFFSPFSYRDQCAVYIPSDFPPPPEFRAPENIIEQYQERLASEILRLAELSNGGALVLFTSYMQLNAMASLLSENSDFPIISQADYGPATALELFKKEDNAILLGTSSFWQGVDIPGSTLRLLIITKLMFQPPDDPIFSARSDLLKSQNRNSFMELALPYSSNMLRQGFGRLIRSENDRGVVAILDTRIQKKFYGNILIANLPRAELCTNFNSLKNLVKKNQLFSL